MEVRHVWENGRGEEDNLPHCHFSSHEPGGRKNRAGGRSPRTGKMEEMHQWRDEEKNVVCSLLCASKGQSLPGHGEAVVRAQRRCSIISLACDVNTKWPQMLFVCGWTTCPCLCLQNIICTSLSFLSPFWCKIRQQRDNMNVGHLFIALWLVSIICV